MNHKQLKQERDAPATHNSDWDGETIIEQVWHDLQGRVSRTDILQVILQIRPKYEYARITTFVPLFIRREAVATLRARLAETNPDQPGQTPGKPRVEASSDGDTAGSPDQNIPFTLLASG